MPTKRIDIKKQEELIDRLESILFQNSSNKTFTLYDLDNIPELQEQIMAMVPDLKKEFYSENRTGVIRPNILKRPYLSIAKSILQKRYNMLIENYRQNGVATKKYHFSVKV